LLGDGNAPLATGTLSRLTTVETVTSAEWSKDGFGQANFDVSRDGSRIVLPISQSDSYQLVVVPNWLAEFRQRLAANRN